MCLFPGVQRNPVGYGSLWDILRNDLAWETGYQKPAQRQGEVLPSLLEALLMPGFLKARGTPVPF